MYIYIYIVYEITLSISILCGEWRELLANSRLCKASVFAATTNTNIHALHQYVCRSYYHWEFQDPKLEVLYHERAYFIGIFPYIGLYSLT